jgi:hypothetical protein
MYSVAEVTEASVDGVRYTLLTVLHNCDLPVCRYTQVNLPLAFVQNACGINTSCLSVDLTITDW